MERKISAIYILLTIILLIPIGMAKDFSILVPEMGSKRIIIQVKGQKLESSLAQILTILEEKKFSVNGSDVYLSNEEIGNEVRAKLKIEPQFLLEYIKGKDNFQQGLLLQNIGLFASNLGVNFHPAENEVNQTKISINGIIKKVTNQELLSLMKGQKVTLETNEILTINKNNLEKKILEQLKVEPDFLKAYLEGSKLNYLTEKNIQVMVRERHKLEIIRPAKSREPFRLVVLGKIQKRDIADMIPFLEEGNLLTDDGKAVSLPLPQVQNLFSENFGLTWEYLKQYLESSSDKKNSLLPNELDKARKEKYNRKFIWPKETEGNLTYLHMGKEQAITLNELGSFLRTNTLIGEEWNKADVKRIVEEAFKLNRDDLLDLVDNEIASSKQQKRMIGRTMVNKWQTTPLLRFSIPKEPLVRINAFYLGKKVNSSKEDLISLLENGSIGGKVIPLDKVHKFVLSDLKMDPQSLLNYLKLTSNKEGGFLQNEWNDLQSGRFFSLKDRKSVTDPEEKRKTGNVRARVHINGLGLNSTIAEWEDILNNNSINGIKIDKERLCQEMEEKWEFAPAALKEYLSNTTFSDKNKNGIWWQEVDAIREKEKSKNKQIMIVKELKQTEIMFYANMTALSIWLSFIDKEDFKEKETTSKYKYSLNEFRIFINLYLEEQKDYLGKLKNIIDSHEMNPQKELDLGQIFDLGIIDSAKSKLGQTEAFFSLFSKMTNNFTLITKNLEEMVQNESKKFHKKDKFAVRPMLEGLNKAKLEVKRIQGVEIKETLTYDSLLITPIQRVPRYALLFADLVKSTLPSHPNYQYLNEKLNLLKQKLDWINEEKRKADIKMEKREFMNKAD